MKNDFEIRGDTSAIFLKRRDGSVLETLIDTDDLDHVGTFQFTWFAHWSPDLESFYAEGNSQKVNGRQKTIRFSRWVLNAPSGACVDHINHDTLDNRRSNLRIVSNAENQQNHLTARSDSASGIRGVYWHKRTQQWVACVRVNGRLVFYKYFHDIHDAEKAVIKARAELMPYSLEAMRGR